MLWLEADRCIMRFLPTQASCKNPHAFRFSWRSRATATTRENHLRSAELATALPVTLRLSWRRWLQQPRCMKNASFFNIFLGKFFNSFLKSQSNSKSTLCQKTCQIQGNPEHVFVECKQSENYLSNWKLFVKCIKLTFLNTIYYTYSNGSNSKEFIA